MMTTRSPARNLALALTLATACSLSAFGQCTPAPWSLATTYAGGNGCSGNFFDVVANVNVNVCSFDVHLGTSTAETMEVWAVTGGGSFVPVSGSPAAWTLLATTTVTAAGLGVPTPLNLNLGYAIPGGATQGFLIRDITSTNIDYTNGTTFGATYAANADLSILEGHYTCTIGATFPVLTVGPRIWNGTIRYSTSNQLSFTQTSQAVADLSIRLAMIEPLATEGWMLFSTDTSLPVGVGPFFGILPDVSTFFYLFTSPLADGSLLHFPVPSPTGRFPTAPYNLPPGSVSSLSGQTVDFVVILIGAGSAFAGQSGVVRMTF